MYESIAIWQDRDERLRCCAPGPHGRRRSENRVVAELGCGLALDEPGVVVRQGLAACRRGRAGLVAAGLWIQAPASTRSHSSARYARVRPSRPAPVPGVSTSTGPWPHKTYHGVPTSQHFAHRRATDGTGATKDEDAPWNDGALHAVHQELHCVHLLKSCCASKTRPRLVSRRILMGIWIDIILRKIKLTAKLGIPHHTPLPSAPPPFMPPTATVSANAFALCRLAMAKGAAPARRSGSLNGQRSVTT